ncbi:Uncharacterised protein [Mycobacteroides abscessus subsp. massiliense]|nr:hypothetical protein MMCCUG48898_0846 [Mycobacteroides abscessus subsp. massiliense CCUG 48898 = JCM 15300]CPU57042.1 Uncharacterised protein [Mycobacteroides abscessus]SKE51554.1 Uncharacterised protein [Mycobacteroides abscessus subsp. massiliense]SLC55728.1 Uncharacterised protein [Mycobacteroides abscessus subsp. bolletii]BBB40492.1 hypothetical protein MASB_10580 [Mycobacteroides abscessus subsp. bolletii BD]
MAMSSPGAGDAATNPADARAMFVSGCVIVLLSGGYAAFRMSMVVSDRSFPGSWVGVELSIAFMVGFLGTGCTIIADRVEHDRSLLPAFASLCLGAAAGVLLADFVFGVPLYLAGALVIVGLGLGVIYRLRRRRIARLLVHGYQTDAVVVQLRESGADGDSFYEEARYTVSFVGEDGEPRTVTGRAMFPTGCLPKIGEIVTIWTDPQRPARHVLRRRNS